jgi:hypothetical protein
MTNLPPELQSKFGYDPQKAAAQLAAEKQHAEEVRKADIERQKKLAALAGPVQAVRLVSIVDDYGLCEIETAKGIIKAYVLGVPDDVRSFLTRYQQLRNTLAEQAAYAKRAKAAADRADANAPVGASGDAAYVQAANAQRVAANNLLVDAKQAAESVEQTKEELSDMKAKLGESTTFNAYPTGLKDNGTDRWQAVQ